MRPTTTLSMISTGSILRDSIMQLKRELKKEEVSNPSYEAMIMLQHVLGISRTQLLQIDLSSHQLTAKQYQHLQYCMMQRLCNYPLSYIIHRRSFWNHDFVVTPSTLDPRPETEGLVHLGLQFFSEDRCNILDLGTGSGCILLSLLLARRNWHGVGIDFRQRTLQIAKHNADRLHISKRAKFRYGNWYKSPSVYETRQYHLCTCNAPYIPSNRMKLLSSNVRYEPREALYGGEYGLLSYKYILKNIDKYLLPSGLIIMEHDPEQYKQIVSMIINNDLIHHSSHRDDSNKMRITIAQVR